MATIRVLFTSPGILTFETEAMAPIAIVMRTTFHTMGILIILRRRD